MNILMPPAMPTRRLLTICTGITPDLCGEVTVSKWLHYGKRKWSPIWPYQLEHCSNVKP